MMKHLVWEIWINTPKRQFLFGYILDTMRIEAMNSLANVAKEEKYSFKLYMVPINGNQLHVNVLLSSEELEQSVQDFKNEMDQLYDSLPF